MSGNYNQVKPLSLGKKKSKSKNVHNESNRKDSMANEVTKNDQAVYPPGLKEFVIRCNEEAVKRNFDSKFLSIMQNQMKNLISKAYSQKKEFVNDWRAQDLPVFTSPIAPLQLVCDREASSSTSSSKKQSSAVQNVKVQAAENDSEEARRRKRLERFASDHTVKKRRHDHDENYSDLNAISTNYFKFDKNKPVVGRCQILEKKYLRLTSEPNPDLVRPLPVLKKAYKMLMEKYSKKEAAYQYLCDQFKSMRQDLRVQIIEDSFTVKVYQTHARIALENGDIGEFNQCQSRLKQLFEIPSIKPSDLEEFTSYNIFYYLMMNNHSSINELRLKLMTKHRDIYKDPMVQSALQMAQAHLIGDYHKLLKIYSRTHGPARCLVDTFINRERLRALATICKSYYQIKLQFLVSEFHFKDNEDAFKFIQDLGLVGYIVVKNEGQKNEYIYLDTKACRPAIIQQFERSKKVDIKGQI